MNNSVEIIEELRYKLRMFEAPIYGATDIFCDNGEVCVITTRPKSTPSKENHIIAYYSAREAVAGGTARLSKDHT